MKNLAVNHLMILLAVYRGTYDNELKLGNHAGEVARLVDAGLLDRAYGAGSKPFVTGLGRATIDNLLKQLNFAAEGQDQLRVDVNVVAIDLNRDFGLFRPASLDGMQGYGYSKFDAAPVAIDGKQLHSASFFMVASGMAEYMGQHRGKLSKPPTAVHNGVGTASEEAKRLASENPGEKFFVLRAVEVHQVEKRTETVQKVKVVETLVDEQVETSKLVRRKL